MEANTSLRLGSKAWLADSASAIATNPNSTRCRLELCLVHCADNDGRPATDCLNSAENGSYPRGVAGSATGSAALETTWRRRCGRVATDKDRHGHESLPTGGRTARHEATRGHRRPHPLGTALPDLPFIRRG